LDGAALFVFAGADSWIVVMPQGDLLSRPNPGLFWHEPESTSRANLVSWEDIQILVQSESFFPPGPINNNGAQVTVTNGISIGGVTQDLNVVFTDNGDVPEPSTLSYIIVTALVSAICFRRKLRTPLRRGC
jgi:hypothetical protein